jgi:hypothetical protein
MLQDSDCNDNFHGNHLGVSSDYQWSIFEMRNEYSTIHAYKWYMSDTHSPYVCLYFKNGLNYNGYNQKHSHMSYTTLMV